jgi:serine/threonine protein phosphatase PrpC
MSNREAVDIIWNTLKESTEPSCHRTNLHCAEIVLKAAAHHRSLDNISVVLIAFNNFVPVSKGEILPLCNFKENRDLTANSIDFAT